MKNYLLKKIPFFRKKNIAINFDFKTISFLFFVVKFVNNVLLQTFSANVDRYSIRNNPLPYPVYGRFVRLHIRGWRSHISMRLELYGCPWSKCFIFETLHLELGGQGAGAREIRGREAGEERAGSGSSKRAGSGREMRNANYFN